jgi:hypothetical protein
MTLAQPSDALGASNETNSELLVKLTSVGARLSEIEKTLNEVPRGPFGRRQKRQLFRH